MIADRKRKAVSFLSRLRFAAPAGHKARQALAHRVYRLRGLRTWRLMADLHYSPSFYSSAYIWSPATKPLSEATLNSAIVYGRSSTFSLLALRWLTLSLGTFTFSPIGVLRSNRECLAAAYGSF